MVFPKDYYDVLDGTLRTPRGSCRHGREENTEQDEGQESALRLGSSSEVQRKGTTPGLREPHEGDPERPSHGWPPIIARSSTAAEAVPSGQKKRACRPAPPGMRSVPREAEPGVMQL